MNAQTDTKTDTKTDYRKMWVDLTAAGEGYLCQVEGIDENAQGPVLGTLIQAREHVGSVAVYRDDRGQITIAGRLGAGIWATPISIVHAVDSPPPRLDLAQADITALCVELRSSSPQASEWMGNMITTALVRVAKRTSEVSWYISVPLSLATKLADAGHPVIMDVDDSNLCIWLVLQGQHANDILSALGVAS